MGFAELIFRFACALLLTLVIEIPSGMLILRRRDAVVPLVLVNLLTNPLLNLILLFSGRFYPAAVAVGEIAVVITEALLLRMMLGCGRKKAAVCSLLINVFSFVTGIVTGYFINL